MPFNSNYVTVFSTEKKMCLSHFAHVRLCISVVLCAQSTVNLPLSTLTLPRSQFRLGASRLAT